MGLARDAQRNGHGLRKVSADRHNIEGGQRRGRQRPPQWNTHFPAPRPLSRNSKPISPRPLGVMQLPQRSLASLRHANSASPIEIGSPPKLPAVTPR
jgi:hypothetical protein